MNLYLHQELRAVGMHINQIKIMKLYWLFQQQQKSDNLSNAFASCHEKWAGVK